MYKKYYSLAKSVLSLDRTVINAVSADDKLSRPAICIYLLPHVVNLLLGALIFPSGFGAIFNRFLTWSIFIPPLAMFGSIFLVFLLLTQYFKVKMRFEGIFRVVAFASIVIFSTMVPYILAVFGLLDPFFLFGFFWLISGLWMLFVLNTYLKSLHGLDQNKVLIAIACAILTFWLLNRIFGNLFIGVSYNFL
ncbi:hypothetical protein HY604_00655 [Candidatus Peregrinibacteria bacterium]|nr:hypothetical protein [Candidatus Peregrinibacteria bacterium]